MGGYDPGLDELKSFCSLLEGTNKLLEVAAPDLDAASKAIVESEPDLREALAGLETETDGLQKEVDATETEAVAAVTQLAATAKQLLETRLPALEGQVDEWKEHSDKATNERAESLQSEFDALESEGFDRFESVMGTEQADVDRWIEQGEAALRMLAEDAGHAREAFDGGLQTAVAGLTQETEATQALHDGLSARLGANVHELADSLTADLEKRAADSAGGMAEWMGERQEALRAEAEAAHGMIQVSAADVETVVEDAHTKAAGVVEATSSVLEQADLEFEQVFADVKSSGRDIADIADLRPRIETADAEVTEIRALMQVLNEP